MSKNTVSLFNKFYKDDLDNLDISIEDLKISTNIRNANNDQNWIKLQNLKEQTILLNKHDAGFSPTDNELIFSISFRINKPELLFGENGVTLKNNEIGIAVTLSSNKSSFQRTLRIGTLKSFNSNKSFEFIYHFKESFLRDSIRIDFFFFLASNKKTHKNHSDLIGSRLSDNFATFTLLVDGDGSIFPITEFSEHGGPLWKFNKFWTDANEDSFDIDNLSLSLNNKHKYFEKLVESNTLESKRVLKEILSSTLELIIYETCLEIKEDSNEINSNSISSVVDYWTRNYNINTNSLTDIRNSIQVFLEKESI